MEDYQGYHEWHTQQPPVDRKPKHKRAGKRTFALVLSGALLGSVLGGGAVGLYMSSQVSAFNNAAQAYIDQAVTSAVSDSVQIGTQGDSSTEQTVYNQINEVTTDYSTAVQSVAQSVMPSVVGVRTIEDVMGFRQMSEVEGVGTGVIVSSDGLILTNQHVVSSNPKSITVTLMDGLEYDAQVLYANEDMDLAVIKIDGQNLPTVSLGNSDNLTVGEVAIAIGNPLGLEYERSVTAGIISALDRSILISQYQIAENLIQTDAAINSGNSGGPLLNANGEVIGINTYKLSSGEGMGFAIPINAAKPIIDQIISTGTFSQVQMGVSVIDSELLSYYENTNLSFDHGIYIYEIDGTSDAYAQGLRKGDIITHVDGAVVNTVLGFRTELYRHLPGDSVTIAVERGSDTFDLTVKLGAA
jgi:serine protease Do